MIDELEPKTEPVTEPPKRWRNWWRPRRSGFASCDKCGYRRRVAAATVYPSHCSTWSSRDIAETKAADVLAYHSGRLEYVGAFPEGERP